LGHVGRNRIRRRARAVLDQLIPSDGCDVVIGVRPGAEATFDALFVAVRRALGASATTDGKADRVG
jgi:RNase P protein component